MKTTQKSVSTNFQMRTAPKGWLKYTTTIWQPDTNLPFEYLVLSWLLGWCGIPHQVLVCIYAPICSPNDLTQRKVPPIMSKLNPENNVDYSIQCTWDNKYQRWEHERFFCLITSSVNYGSNNFQKLRMRRALVKLLGLGKLVIKILTGCLSVTKVTDSHM